MLAIILGSGLSKFSNHFEIIEKTSFSEFLNIEYQPINGHLREIHIAKYNGKEFVIISGRLHYYEGYSFAQISKPLAFSIQKHGIKKFIITSICGALAKHIKIGEWVDIDTVVALPTVCQAVIQQSNTKTTKGNTYAFHQGPSYGTLSEYKMMHYLGASTIGMSVLPEAKYLKEKGVHFEIKTLPICQYFPFDTLCEPCHEEVLDIANLGVEKLVTKIKTTLNNIK
ncbi:MAG: hypothetical protein V3V14_03650 [Saprospiraceae bacterium]